MPNTATTQAAEPTGSKYHRIHNCGNMNPDKARQVPLSEAASEYKQCSDCW